MLVLSHCLLVLIINSLVSSLIFSLQIYQLWITLKFVVNVQTGLSIVANSAQGHVHFLATNGACRILISVAEGVRG